MNKKTLENQEEVIISVEEIKKEMTPKKDYIFKRLFSSVGKEKIVKDFLEAILEVKIDSVTLGQDTRLLAESIEGKTGILDVKVTLEDGSIVDVEMQNTKNKFIAKRALFYASRMYSSQLPQGGIYQDLNKVIVIFIMDFNLFEDIENYHTKWLMTEENNLDMQLDEMELHFIELPKFLMSTCNKKSKLDQWLLFIDYSRKELLKEVMEENKNVKDAEEELRKLQMDEYLQEIAIRERLNEVERNYNARLEREEAEQELEKAREQAKKEGMEKGIEKGMEKGIAKSKKEIVKKMLEKNMNIEVIKEITELSEEEIKEIINENK